VNLRYDGNLRSAIGLASGRYVILMGNDDCLAGPDTLQRLHDIIIQHPNAGVVVTNFADWKIGKKTRRVLHTRVLRGSPATAVATFRNFAFVSGLILRTDAAQRHATDRWDGTEMYQMYLAARLLSDGADLLEWDQVAVRKDIQVAGQMVDNYARKPRIHPCPIVERKLPLIYLGRVVYDGINADGRAKDGVAFRIFLQIVLFTYPYWIVEYRRVQSWNYAAGLCFGMRPANLICGVRLPFLARTLLQLVYCAVTAAGLAFPIGLFQRIYPMLHRVAKRCFRVKCGDPAYVN
jgi:hypothetical protein